MKRKFIELEVDTELTNKELKEKDRWSHMRYEKEKEVLKIIQIKVNAVSDWKRKEMK